MAILLARNNDAQYFMTQYLKKQIIDSIGGSRELSGSRFTILFAICRDMLVPFVFAALVTFIMYKIKNISAISIHYRLLLYYSCIAIISSMPIMISQKQMRWYVFPSFPFYVLAISVAFNDTALALERFILANKNIYYHIKYLHVVILFLSLLMMFLGKHYIGRYKEFYNDFSLQFLHIEPRETIAVYPENILNNWSLIANMQRHFKISLDKDFGHKYLLSTTEYTMSNAIPSAYKLFHPEHPKKYILFRSGHEQ
jgi:hypothetical protein